jgi:hypothetical protein
LGERPGRTQDSRRRLRPHSHAELPWHSAASFPLNVDSTRGVGALVEVDAESDETVLAAMVEQVLADDELVSSS